MPTVSVVIPAYNRADVLGRAMDSVLNQTHDELELIVVDDGSTDDTEAVVTGYDDPRVTYVAHETNRGGNPARNTGIDRATGEYVAFLDSDDEWLPTKLERQVATLEARSDDWVAAYCGVELVPASEPNPVVAFLTDVLSRRRETEGAEGGAELVKDVLADDLHTSAGSALLVERSVAEEIDGFDESFSRFADPEFLIRVLWQGKLAYVDAPLLRRYDTGSPDADAVREADEHYLRTFSDTVERLEAQGHDVTGAHHYILARHYFREGNLRLGLRYLLTSRSPEPRQYPGLAGSIVSGLRRRVA